MDNSFFAWITLIFLWKSQTPIAREQSVCYRYNTSKSEQTIFSHNVRRACLRICIRGSSATDFNFDEKENKERVAYD